jgi:hypothetical protein
MNITNSGQFGKLKGLMGKSPVILVFVYADWCGHCQHFKPDWKKLEMNKSRNMPMVSIRDDVFTKSPLNNMITPEGYPTVAVVSPANNTSFNLPTREPTKLTKLVQNAEMLDPQSVASTNLDAKVNSVLEGSVVPSTSEDPTKVSSNTSRIHLVNETNEVSVETQKPPTHVVPVTRDTVEPPLSETEYLERESKKEMPRINQLGGVWSSLSAYNRRRAR